MLATEATVGGPRVAEARMRLLLFALLLFTHALGAAPRQVDAHRWEGVERIVAIGDLHGDHDRAMLALRGSGLVDARGRWSGGATHLVQTGDIADRGPDTRRIVALLRDLSRQAERAGGRVHVLLGNHEAMNVLGDLRYVTAGEYAAFADRRSPSRRDRYYEAVIAALRKQDPDAFATLPDDHRTQWDQAHPLGWVEHRLAWDPRWGTDGEMFQWAVSLPVAVQINDIVFVHGGISGAYCGNSLESLTSLAHAALRRPAAGAEGLDILLDQDGPLWHRGLAGEAPAATPDLVDAILGRHGARHIVVAHTPTGGVVWPRLDGRVILIDTGISDAYGGHVGWLEATPGRLFAGYPGGKVALPADDRGRLAYLDAVIALQPGNAELIRRRETLLAGDPPAGPDDPETLPATAAAPAPVTCDTVQ
jgi:3',5'-cyclic AMP phosphodiesterase CpdA